MLPVVSMAALGTCLQRRLCRQVVSAKVPKHWIVSSIHLLSLWVRLEVGFAGCRRVNKVLLWSEQGPFAGA